MRTGMNLGYYYKLGTKCGLCKEIILCRSGFCNKVVIKYALVIFEITMHCLTQVIFVQRWNGH